MPDISNPSKVVSILWSKTTVINNHWLFNGTRITGGHGMLGMGRRGYIELVHRLSAHIFHGMELGNGDIQANHKVTCPYKNCWNPDCLYIGNQKDNMNDLSLSGNHWNTVKDSCLRGHPFTEENTLIENRPGGRKKRTCRKCVAERMRESRKRRRLNHA